MENDVKKPQSNVEVTDTPLENGGSANPKQLTKKSKKKFWIAVIIMSVLVCVITAFWFFTNHKTANLPPPDPANVILATIGDKEIRYTDVKKIALESYLGSAVTSSIIKETIPVAVERAVLENEAKLMGLNTSIEGEPAEFYQKLKSEVTQGKVISVTEYDISWWIPPEPYEQLPEFEEQRKVQNEMANEIQTRFRSGDDPYVIVKETAEKYRIFQGILGLNGALVSNLKPEDVTQPRILLSDSEDQDKPFFTLLFNAQKGQVVKGIWSDGSGGAVISVVDLTEGESIDYASWLKSKIESSVTYNTVEISKL